MKRRIIILGISSLLLMSSILIPLPMASGLLTNIFSSDCSLNYSSNRSLDRSPDHGPALSPDFSPGDDAVPSSNIGPRYQTPELGEFKGYKVVGRGSRSPPPANTRTPGEYECTQGVLLKFPLSISSSSVKTFFAEMTGAIVEDVPAYIVCEDSSHQSWVESYLSSRGIALDNIIFLLKDMDTIWMRDYGPNFVWLDDGSLGVIDTVYKDGRPNDDSFPSFFAQEYSLSHYDMPIHSEGGNYACDSYSTSFSTVHIHEENEGDYTAEEVDTLVKDYYKTTRFLVTDRLIGEGTGHIDMFFKPLDPHTLLLGEYPPGDANYQTLEDVYDYLSNQSASDGKPYEIIRIPMPSGYGDWYTYTNSLFVNDMILVPKYNIPEDGDAYQTYSDALPGYEVVMIDSTAVIQSGGAIHCTTMSIPGIDEEAPQINHNPVVERGMYDEFMVWAYVHDNVRVHEAYVEYAGLDGEEHNITMDYNPGDYRYEAVIPAQNAVGSLNYSISAVDTSAAWNSTPTGNWKRTPIYSVDIYDNVEPTIIHTPTPFGEIGYPIEVITTVTDNLGVEGVYMEFTGVNGTTLNTSMENTGGSGYAGYLPSQHEMGEVIYMISATDEQGNFVHTDYHALELRDTTGPMIYHRPRDRYGVGRQARINCSLADKFAVSHGYVTWDFLSGSGNSSLTKVENNWVCYLGPFNNLGTLKYRIHALDTEGNKNNTMEYSVSVEDVDAPVLSIISAQLAEIGRPIDFKVGVTDNIEVKQVFLQVNVNGSKMNNSMVEDEGSYHYTLSPVRQKTNVSYNISARDTSNNWAMTSGWIEMKDTIPPGIIVRDNVTVEAGEDICLEVKGEDNWGIARIRLEYTAPNRSTLVYWINDASAEFEFPCGRDIGPGSVEVYVEDLEGNFNSTVVGVSVVDTSPPVITHPPREDLWVGKPLEIESRIVDNTAITEVYVNYSFDNGKSKHIDMTEEDGNYVVVIGPWDGEGNLTYSIHARDGTGIFAVNGPHVVSLVPCANSTMLAPWMARTVESNVTLRWETDDRPEYYHVYLGQEPDDMALLQNTTGTEYQCSLTAPGTYYWTVIPFVEGYRGKSLTGTWNFTVLGETADDGDGTDGGDGITDGAEGGDESWGFGPGEGSYESNFLWFALIVVVILIVISVLVYLSYGKQKERKRRKLDRGPDGNAGMGSAPSRFDTDPNEGEGWSSGSDRQDQWAGGEEDSEMDDLFDL